MIKKSKSDTVKFNLKEWDGGEVERKRDLHQYKSKTVIYTQFMLPKWKRIIQIEICKRFSNGKQMLLFSALNIPLLTYTVNDFEWKIHFKWIALVIYFCFFIFEKKNEEFSHCNGYNEFRSLTHGIWAVCMYLAGAKWVKRKIRSAKWQNSCWINERNYVLGIQLHVRSHISKARGKKKIVEIEICNKNSRKATTKKEAIIVLWQRSYIFTFFFL